MTRILIADDEERVVKSIRSFLEKRGVYVNFAFDGKQALDLIKKNVYDIAFLDHNMPELTGLELIKFIKQNKPKMKTIMISGYPGMREFFAKAVGADEYLTKPCSLKDIERIVDKYSDRRGKFRRIKYS